MERLLLSLAGRLNPAVLNKKGRDRAVGLSNILALRYVGPIAVAAFVWLVAATEPSALLHWWLLAAIVFVLVYAFRRLDM
ncbi:MAG: hypothetical protein JXB46_10860, partial [Candidatus Eisenbacteria bacterium]|nr:hypothetical protein [Candidatus Eisenbacteria bacterium]